jgi:hypothetical protein
MYFALRRAKAASIGDWLAETKPGGRRLVGRRAWRGGFVFPRPGFQHDGSKTVEPQKMICGFEFFDLTNAQASEQENGPVSPRKTLENASLYCTFTALPCKSLIINRAGEGIEPSFRRMEFIVDGWRKPNVRTQKVLSCSIVGIFLF